MKFTHYLILGVTLLLTAQSSIAQFNTARRGERGYSPPRRAAVAYEAEKPDATLRSQENADLYAQELEIDAFKKEVLKSYLKDYYTTKFNVMYDEELKYDQKQPLLNEAKKKLEKDLEAVFIPKVMNQILAFEDIGAERIKKEKKKREKNEKKRKKG